VIGFGYQGKPLFIQGPEDDAARIIKKLKRKVGRDGFQFFAPA
jgi:hypothetical protein